MNRFFRPSLSDSWPKNRAPITWPIRYQVAMSATAPADMFSVLLRVRSGPMLLAMVISNWGYGVDDDQVRFCPPG